jgi:hypothetical protein
MFKVVVDFAYDEKIQSILTLLEKYAGQIDSFQAIGSAGGNPNLVLRFEQRGQAVDLLRDRYPDDSLEFCNSRVVGPLNPDPVIKSPFAVALVRRLLAYHAEVGDGDTNRLAAETLADLPEVPN